MKTIHLNQCNSTQEYLKIHLDNLLAESKNVLVSTDLQLSGKGRSGNMWHFYENALAFSFTLAPCESFTLSSLEIGIILSRFFEEKYKKHIRLKWPNDLYLGEGKCGGILIQSQNNTLVVGIGLNLSKSEGEETRTDEYAHNFLFEHNIFSENFKKIIPEKIYDYILENRLRPQDIIQSFNELCILRNQLVSFEDGENTSHGIFMGIGSLGEALIDVNGTSRSIYSGSIRLISMPT